jgi:hypothetical protein
MEMATPAKDEACAAGGKIGTWVENESSACVFELMHETEKQEGPACVAPDH